MRALQPSLACLLLFIAPASAHAISASDQQSALDTHNNYRSQVAQGLVGAQPAAANMIKMQWDTNLATVAQNYANQCKFAHNANRHADYAALVGGNPVIGENIFTTSAATLSMPSAVALWFNEQVDYTYASNSCGSGMVCGHYTQMVWANSYKLGCGVKTCSSGLPFGNGSGTLLVCNYSPAGNYIGQKPYTSGPAASACPAEFTSAENGLCVASQGNADVPLPVWTLALLGAGLVGAMRHRLGKSGMA